MKRREFITLLGGVVASPPLTTHAQQPAVPVIGFLNSGSAQGYANQVAAFQQGLRESRYRDGENVAITYRWADGQYKRIPSMAAELVRAGVAVIVANGGATGPAGAAKAATNTIPIVFVGGGDPVQSGLVASFNRPGGNITGVVQFGGAMGAKRLELLQQLVPKVATVGILINPDGPTGKRAAADAQSAAQKLGLQFQVLTARTEEELNMAFSSIAASPARALLISGDPFFLGQRVLLAILAARHQIATIYDFRDYTAAGGLMSYGASLSAAYHQLGVYAGKILRGEKPSDLPVVQLSRFELVVNLKTAKALGIEVPDRVLALADEVIE